MANKKNSLKELNKDDLLKNLTDFNNKLKNKFFNTQGSKSKNVKEISFIKKEIAKIMTRLTEMKNSDKNK